MLRGSLKNQLQLITVGPLLFVIVMVSLFLLKDSLQVIDDDLNIRGHEISNQVALMSEFYFYTGNTEELAKVAETFLRRDELDHIRFLDKDKVELARRTKTVNIGQMQLYITPVYSDVKTADFSPAINEFDPDNILGFIEIGLSKTKSDSKRRDVYLRALLIALLAMLSGLGLSYIVGRKLSSLVADLVETAKQIEQNNFAARCAEEGEGELLQFQKIFNNMAESLEVNEKELQEEIDTTLQMLNQTIEEMAGRDKAIEQYREESLDLVRSKAVADERTRIMKDIHDGIGGQLMASLSLIEKEQDSVIRKNIHSILSDCLADFRLIINSLNIHSNTLSALLADYKFSLSKKIANLDIDIDWTMDDYADDVVLPPHHGLHLLRILQEAFTNILKHSGATVIDFHTYEKEGRIIIIIEDNGAFEVNEKTSSGHGLVNMQARAKELRAEIEIGQSDRGGCRIKLSLPMPEKN